MSPLIFFLMKHIHVLQHSSTHCPLYSPANILQLSRERNLLPSPFLSRTTSPPFIFSHIIHAIRSPVTQHFHHQPPLINLPLTITLSFSLVSIIPFSSLTIFSLIFTPVPHTLLRAMEGVILFCQDCTSGERRGSELRRGGRVRGLLGQIHFQSTIFSFVFLQHFTAIQEEGKREEKKRKKGNHTHAHTHILKNGPDGHQS